MTFSKKIFIAVFLSTLAVGSILTFAAYKYTVNRSEQEFISRYHVFTKILADTLSRLDTSTESLMLNAAKVVTEKDAQKGLLSTKELQALRSELGITHLFLTDRAGRFIRSTNDDVDVIPNLYSFCGEYKKLVTGGSSLEATPIIKPNPEPKPHKFLLVPNKDRSRIIEVGIRVDFIAKTLAEALKSDKSVRSMSLYAPDGTPFGTFSEDKVNFHDDKAKLPDSFDKPILTANTAHFYTKVLSSHPKCCQCDVSGTSKNGEYYYVLESRVSKGELNAMQAKAGIIFLLVGFGNALLSYILARLLSRRLVRNIETAVSRVRKIKEEGNVADRIALKTEDEISFLTGEFDRLLDSLEDSQKQLVEAEKVKSKVELARIVAHNIKSPALAIEMMLPSLFMVPEKMKKVLKNSVSEIKQLSEKLKNNSESLTTDMHIEAETEIVFLPIFLDELARQKNLEFSKVKESTVNYKQPHNCDGLFVKVNPLEFKSVLSNIINNAFESYGSSGGLIDVELLESVSSCTIRVKDFGAGIPQEYLQELGTKCISFKGCGSRGMGLKHAFERIKFWDGDIEIKSEMGVGTSISISLPLIRKNKLEDLDGQQRFASI